LPHGLSHRAYSTVAPAREIGCASRHAGGGTPASAAQAIGEQQAQWRSVGKELNVEPQ
jgi:hypothetical protein